MLEDIYRGYSNALEEFDEPFMQAWAAEVETQRLRAFLSEWGALLDATDEGLTATLDRWAKHDGRSPANKFEATWCPQFSLLRQPVEPHATDWPLIRAASLALHLHANGAPGEWHAAFSTPAGFAFDSYWLEGVQEVWARSDGESVDLELSGPGGHRRVTFRQTARGWAGGADAPASYPVLPWGGVNVRVMPLLRAQRDADARVIPADPVMVETLRQARELLEDISPAYAAWVRRLMRYVVPWRLTPGVFHNASTPHCHGCVMMTIHDDVLRVAETFVHEVSHHHFDVLESMGPFINGRDEKLYYSPPREEDRPLRSILIAYHAFMNVLIFYRLYEFKSLRLKSDFSRTIEQLLDWRETLEGHLESSDGLTPLGESLWRGLASRARLFDLLSAA